MMATAAQRPSGLLQSRQKQSGYILIMTIAALALLAMAGAYIGQQVSTAVRLAIAEQSIAEEEKRARDTMASMMFLVSTTKRSAIGLGDGAAAVRMDGRWYKHGDDMAVSIQDGRGLINLQTAPRVVLERLLTSYGIPIERSSYLIDALEDYRDEDSLRRLQGAEADEYKSAGLLAPRNQPLISPLELRRVFGWSKEARLWERDTLVEQLVLGEDTGINPATAGKHTLMAALNISERDAQNFINARAALDSQGVEQLAQPFFGEFGADDMLKLHRPVLFPSVTTVIRVNRIGSMRVWRATLTITPSQDQGAWRVNDYHALSLAEPLLVEGLPALPDVSAWRAALPRPEDIKLPF